MALDFLGRNKDSCKTTFDRIDNFDSMMKDSGLNWTVRADKVFTEKNKQIPGVSALIREDNDSVLGMVSGRYNIVQNSESFKFAEALANSEGFTKGKANVGYFKGGRSIYCQLELPKVDVLGDDVQPYLFVTNSFDGNSTFKAGITNIRIICNNTLQMAIRTAPRLWSISHKREWKPEEILAQANKTLELSDMYEKSFIETAEKMAAQKVDADKIFELLRERLSKSMTEGGVETTISRIKSIYEEKEDLQNLIGSAYGLYNAVADYVSNANPLKLTKTFETKRTMMDMTGYPLLGLVENILQDQAA